MGLGPIKNGKQQVITPRDGKAWCDVVNQKEAVKPLVKPEPKPSGSYLWLGDLKT